MTDPVGLYVVGTGVVVGLPTGVLVDLTSVSVTGHTVV